MLIETLPWLTFRLRPLLITINPFRFFPVVVLPLAKVSSRVYNGSRRTSSPSHKSDLALLHSSTASSPPCLFRIHTTNPCSIPRRPNSLLSGFPLSVLDDFTAFPLSPSLLTYYLVRIHVVSPCTKPLLLTQRQDADLPSSPSRSLL
jgi:hypothetical protein